jgi:hypothetical protein
MGAAAQRVRNYKFGRRQGVTAASRVVEYYPTSPRATFRVVVLEFKKASVEEHATRAMAELHNIVDSIAAGRSLSFASDVEDLLDRAVQAREKEFDVEERSARLAEDVGNLKD